MIIRKEIHEETNECEKTFKCLNNKKNIYCEVISNVSNKVHFVECLTEEYCNYQFTFGYKCVCSCPTRKEIYNKYGI